MFIAQNSHSNLSGVNHPLAGAFISADESASMSRAQYGLKRAKSLGRALMPV
jgi:hypothetical protein